MMPTRIRGMRRFGGAFAVLGTGLLVFACGGVGTTGGTAGTTGSGGGGGEAVVRPGPVGAGGSSAPDVVLTDPGIPVSLTPLASSTREEARLSSQLAKLDGLSAAGLAERFPVKFEAAPSYERSSILGLDKIQASSLALDESELLQLDRQGFVISGAHQFPTFAYGYQTLYLEDLPLYVSADSILNAVHVSYDSILKTLEIGPLSSELDKLLSGMHQNLKAGVGEELGEAAVADADVFVAIARSLLLDSVIDPVAGGSKDVVSKLFHMAQAARGTADVSLFGVTRKDEDFSQFKPRGHYTDSEFLANYFRAMMWLGRVDLRLLETQEDGSQIFRRRQLETMLLLRQLIGSELRPHFDRVDRTVAAFVGEPDYMVLSEVDGLMNDLGLTGLAGLAAIPDQQLAQAIIDGDYGAQRISSHIMINGVGVGTLPLSRSFALLGQRYTIDSHVFSNVVYDRVGLRMMPDPLDVAFAALGNDQAAALLAPELEEHEATGYPAALAQMRLLTDDHPQEFWDASLYTHWLGALRTLSAANTTGASDAASLFPVARTEAWGRRLLNTGLASWAELRHDTILYVKQSYSGGDACEFPDAYVDPYPELFRSIAQYGSRGSALIEELDLLSSHGKLASQIGEHFALVTAVATRLKEMAEHERTGAAFTPAMMEFINDAVVISSICGGDELDAGWYRQLFFEPSAALELDPTIADVHTQPTEIGGAPVGRVLHVATGLPRAMVVVSEGCNGPRAYAGLASSYFEQVTENFERLDDPTWETIVQGAKPPPEVAWMEDLVSK